MKISDLDNALQKKFGTGWQFIKFNMVSFSVTLLQLVLANLLPLIFDKITIPLPPLLRPIFNPEVLQCDSKYIVNGAITLGYLLPFLLSNAIANIYGYFVNMKATFKGKGNKYSLPIYVIVLFMLIIFSTWGQSFMVAQLNKIGIGKLSRTIAAWAAGIFQLIILFPLEKYVLFK